MKLALGILAVSFLVLVGFEGFYVAIDAERRRLFAQDARTAVLFTVNLPMKIYTTWQLKALRPNNYRGRHRRTRKSFPWPWRVFHPVAQ